MKELCVVHLVRAQNGIEPFRCFLESYREKPGGIEHDLLIAFKGFGRPQDTAEYRKLLEPFRYTSIDISDEGFDITVYFAAVNRYSEHYRYFCFLNSYSVILDRDWLRKLYAYITRRDVGLVGATGSWLSNRTNAIAWFCTLCGATRYLTDSTTVISKGSSSLWEKVISGINEIPTQVTHIVHFRKFPNYHIRTNAFMISSELMMSLKCPSLKTKMDAYKFESGRQGITMQILNIDKTVIVVGKDGIGYEKEDWDKSRTFWQFEQENLMVADNQTRDYQNGSIARRNYLTSKAWNR